MGTLGFIGPQTGCWPWRHPFPAWSFDTSEGVGRRAWGQHVGGGPQIVEFVALLHVLMVYLRLVVELLLLENNASFFLLDIA